MDKNSFFVYQKVKLGRRELFLRALKEEDLTIQSMES